MERTELNEATDATELTDNTEKALLMHIKLQIEVTAAIDI